MKTESKKVEDHKHDPKNARLHSEHNIDAILESLKRFGQQKPIVVNAANVVLAGNGLLEAARLLGWEYVDVVETDLVGTEASAYAIADNRTAELAEWDIDTLILQIEEIAKESQELADATGFSQDEIAELADGLSDDSLYTRKIEAPIYEPTGPKPEIHELYDKFNTDRLVKKIESSDLDGEEKAFLLTAAGRHTQFNHAKIAEFYAHCNKEMQEFMEESALVIIDFDKAIENGFINMTEDIVKLVGKDHHAG